MLRTRLAKLMEAGARDLEWAPGGSTGLLLRCGPPAVPVYKVDTGLLSLLAGLRSHENHAAEELGQWSEKRELPGDRAPAPHLDDGHVRDAG